MWTYNILFVTIDGMVKEEWKTIKDYPDYQVSNLGRIRSLKRNKITPIKPCVSSDNRLRFTPVKDGKITSVSIHRAVLTAFVGECPPNMVACHNDDNCHNNVLSNLRWDTIESNLKDQREHGLFKHGEENGNARLTENAILDIRKRYAEGEKTQDIANDYGIKRLTVNDICCGRCWSHVGGPITFRKKRIKTYQVLNTR